MTRCDLCGWTFDATDEAALEIERAEHLREGSHLPAGSAGHAEVTPSDWT